MENLGIYKFHACTRHNDMSLLFQVYNYSFTEFKQWKEHEEERTHTTCIRENCSEGQCFIKGIYIYIRVLAQVHVLQGTASCAAGMVTTVGINHAICAGK